VGLGAAARHPERLHRRPADRDERGGDGTQRHEQRDEHREPHRRPQAGGEHVDPRQAGVRERRAHLEEDGAAGEQPDDRAEQRLAGRHARGRRPVGADEPHRGQPAVALLGPEAGRRGHEHADRQQQPDHDHDHEQRDQHRGRGGRAAPAEATHRRRADGGERPAPAVEDRVVGCAQPGGADRAHDAPVQPPAQLGAARPAQQRTDLGRDDDLARRGQPANPRGQRHGPIGGRAAHLDGVLADRHPVKDGRPGEQAQPAVRAGEHGASRPLPRLVCRVDVRDRGGEREHDDPERDPGRGEQAAHAGRAGGERDLNAEPELGTEARHQLVRVRPSRTMTSRSA
jgi:hypothetical protein